MATVAEVRAAIDRGNTLIAEAQAAVNGTVNGKLSEARELLNWVRETSIDPLGVPQLDAAIELGEQIAGLTAVAIEQNNIYAGTL